MFAHFPTLCKQIPSVVGECDASIAKYFFTLPIVCSLGVPGACLLGIMCCMITVCWEVMVKKTYSSCAGILMGPSSSSSSLPSGRTNSHHRHKNNNRRRGWLEEKEDLSSSHSDIISDISLQHKKNHVVEHAERIVAKIEQEDVPPSLRNSGYCLPPRRSEHFTRQYHREIVIQAVSFVFAFLLTFSLYWYAHTLLTAKKGISNSLMLSVHIFYPMGGFFNVLAYSRPKIRALRIRKPSYSWFRAFFHVMRTGGDVHVPTRTKDQQHGVACVPPEQEQSTAFGVLNAHPNSDPSIQELSNVALDNCSESFGAENAGYKSENSWKYVISAANESDDGDNERGGVTDNFNRASYSGASGGVTGLGPNEIGIILDRALENAMKRYRN